MVSVATLKEWLGIDAGTTTYDDILEGLESRAVALIEGEADRHFGAVADTTDYIEGSGTRRLWLSEPPSTDPTTVTERAYPGDDDETITATDDDGFVVRTTDREGWLVRKGGYVWTRGYEYEVTYERGYASGSEPEDVQQAVIDIVTRMFQNRTSVGKKSESMGGYSYTMEDGSEVRVSPFAASVIESWRRRRI